MNQLEQLNVIFKDIPALTARFGKDAKQMEAFVQDAKDAAFHNPLMLGEMIDSLLIVYLKAMEGIRDFKWFLPGTWDTFKKARLQCDDIARIMDFKRYKALRNL